MVYAKPPFAGPETVPACLSCYTHRVAISNSRLIRFDESGVTFRNKDYRPGGADRQQIMTLTNEEFIRRFVLHVLPKGYHRIGHYGLLAGATARSRSPTSASCSEWHQRPPTPSLPSRRARRRAHVLATT